MPTQSCMTGLVSLVISGVSICNLVQWLHMVVEYCTAVHAFDLMCTHQQVTGVALWEYRSFNSLSEFM